jgi:hypothetical protein
MKKEIQQGPTKRPSCKAGESNPGGPLKAGALWILCET